MAKFLRQFRKTLSESNKTKKYFKYAIGEIVLVVIGILIALQLNTWQENNKLLKTENNILVEIRNGLQKDLIDLKHNTKGHKNGIYSISYWNKIINNQQVNSDSVSAKYNQLLRTFIAIQNTSSYESLKSRGLELIRNDSLRLNIISLYEEEYQVIKNIEESYSENQFYTNYFKEINQLIAANLVFNEKSELTSIKTPLFLTDKQKKEFKTYLWKIKTNREFSLKSNKIVEEKIKLLIELIESELKILP